MFDMITIGDIKLDTFVVLNDASVQCQLKEQNCLLCLEYGAKIVVNVVDSQVAGTAPNVAIGLARHGRKTAVLSNMGGDGTLAMAYDFLKKNNVSTKLIRRVPGESSAYTVAINFKGEKTMLTSHIRRAYRLPKPFPKPKWIYVGEMGHGYETLYRQIISLVKNNGTHIVLNPGTIQIAERKTFLFDLMKRTYLMFVNVEEAQRILAMETRDIRALAEALQAFGPKHVVVTDGKNGAYAYVDGVLTYCPLFPGRMVEATGAGDAFSTGYIAALMAGETADEALRWGAVNSASVIGYVGPTKGLLSDKQIRAALKKKPGFKTNIV